MNTRVGGIGLGSGLKENGRQGLQPSVKVSSSCSSSLSRVTPTILEASVVWVQVHCAESKVLGVLTR